MQHSAAWAILVQHPAICQDLAIVSRLPCSSKAVSAMLWGAAAGRLTCSPRLPRHLWQRWPRRYGALLQRLEAPFGSGAELAAGLAEAAAAAPGGLRLQSCCAYPQDLLATAPPQPAAATPTALALLQLLPPWHLTSFEVARAVGEASLAALAAGLQRLTSLRELSVRTAYWGTHLLPLQQLLPAALPALRQLSVLRVAAADGWESAHLLNAAAARELLLSGDRDPESPARLQLGHLTGVTRLARFAVANPAPFHTFQALKLVVGDALPPRLQELDLNCTACPGWAGELLPLQALRGLTIAMDSRSSAAAAAGQLRELARLPALARVELKVQCAPSVPAEDVLGAAAGLPVVSVCLISTTWTPPMLQQLSKLSQLTHLSTFHTPLVAAGPAELAAALRALAGALRTLPRLQELQLFNLMRYSGAADPGVTAGTAEWLAATAALPLLRSFAADYRLAGDSVLQLAAAGTQLQDLMLCQVGLTDAHLRALSRLTALTLLDCSFNADLTDAAVEVIGATLRQLQNLDLQALSVTNAGLEHLSQLTKLRQLQISSTGFEGTRAGVAWLLQLRDLQQLSVSSPGVLWRGAMRRLHRHLPRLEIVYDDDEDEPFRSDDDTQDDDSSADEGN